MTAPRLRGSTSTTSVPWLQTSPCSGSGRTDAQLFAGSREDVLRPVNGAWKVAKRTIVLDANVLLDKNLSVFF